MTFAVLFPGQGSQFVGMGDELFSERSDLLGEAADEILGWSLRDMCLDGPEEDLTRTEHAQPALYALSFVLWDSLAAQLPTPPAAAAGHSLGEYTALAAAGAMSFLEGLAVVARRGSAMAKAADKTPSGMAALIGADEQLANDVASKRNEMGGHLQVANINAPGQVVVAGSADDIEWLGGNVRDLGVRRAIPLKVAGAFHSSFMESAAKEVGEALSKMEFSSPLFDVWSNTTARPHLTEDLAETLARQVVSPVRFQEGLEGMAGTGVSKFVHVGPGDVTAGMAKRTVSDAEVVVVSSLEDIPSAVDVIVSVG